MNHQIQIANHRIDDLRNGAKTIADKLQRLAYLYLHDKKQLNVEDIKEFEKDMDELQQYVEWVATR